MELVIKETAHGGNSIAEWRAIFASIDHRDQPVHNRDIFTIRDPEGVTHRIDLRPWRGADQSAVMLHIAFRTRDKAQLEKHLAGRRARRLSGKKTA